MLKLKIYTLKTCQLCQRKSVAKCLFDSVLAKNQIFLNETDGTRLEINYKGNNYHGPKELNSKDRSEGLYVYARCVNPFLKLINNS